MGKYCIQISAVRSSLHVSGKILHRETSMLCGYRIEFLGYTQRKILYTALAAMSFLGILGKTLHSDTSRKVQRY